MAGSTRLGLLVPLSQDVFGRREQHLVDRALAERLVDSVWVRDLPVAPRGDPDGGQGVDPFVYLADLGARGVLPATTGTASIILGARHPLAVARAAVSMVHLLGPGFVLGLGSSGKPPVAQALGLDGMRSSSMGEEWRTVRSALAGDVGGEVYFPRPTAFLPPPMYFASDDPAKWEAIDGDADGWMTFLAGEAQLDAARDRISHTFRRSVRVLVRADLTVVDGQHPGTPGPRGRVHCGRDALPRLGRQWADLPVDDIVVSLTSRDPLRDLATLRMTMGEAAHRRVHRGDPGKGVA